MRSLQREKSMHVARAARRERNRQRVNRGRDRVCRERIGSAAAAARLTGGVGTNHLGDIRLGKRSGIDQAAERADSRPHSYQLILFRRAHRRHI